MKKKYFYLMLAFLMAANIFFSSYISIQSSNQELLTDSTSCFSDSSGCGIVQQSKYSELFGISVSTFGIISFSIATLVFLLLYIFRRELEKKIFIRLTGLMMALGLIFSVWFIYLQLFVIKNICTFCMIVDSIIVLSAAIFFIVFWKNMKL
jgi:uncharacterized membrane protein